MGRCLLCRRESPFISALLALCAECLRDRFESAGPLAGDVHARIRKEFGLPAAPPRAEDGLRCSLCANDCSMTAEEGRGYCGIRITKKGKLSGASKNLGFYTSYYDPLPTNCVADWVCPAGTGCGHPRYAYSRGPEYGYKNLAVFFNSCTFDCLFCQNWHYREVAARDTAEDSRGGHGPDALADQVDDRTACLCYFGGDPASQLPFALQASRRALAENQGRILRICWETNGSMSRPLLKQAAELSLQSGGCLKFDLKAWDEGLHQGLCGVSNRQTLTNFEWLAKEFLPRRPDPIDPPLLVASTLLVPGYVDEEEVSQIAAFVSGLDRNIPYSLLAFSPQFAMRDLPTTSQSHAERCLQAARAAGLRRVRVGNAHLL